MSHDQIADVLQEPPATIRAGLSRAIRRLRDWFKVDDDRVAVHGS
jgi:hypothetical protein